MTSLSSQIARILVAPWQQRRNRHSLPTMAVIGVVVLAAALLNAALVFIHDAAADEHGFFAIYAAVLGAVMVGGAWILVVANVLEQNHPALARLMPDQLHAMRCALVTAMLVLASAAGLVAGRVFGSSPAGIAGAAALLALCAAGVRWAWLWLPLNFVLPVAGIALHAADPWPPLAWLRAAWASAPATAAAVVVVASAVVVSSLVQSGGRRHERAHAQRTRLRVWSAGSTPTLPRAGSGQWSLRPYAWWLERQLAHRRSPMARLMLGLGPVGHWTMHVAGAAVAVAIAAILCAVAACTPFAPALPSIAAGMSFGVTFGLVLPPLQTCQRLWSRRSEQPLLALLPGVPHAGRLNQALALRLMAHFAAAWLSAAAIVAALLWTAESLVPGVVDRGLGSWPAATLLGLLPLGLLLWRRWAAIQAVTSAQTLLACVAVFALAGLVVLLHDEFGLPLAPIAGAYVALTVALGAWRWPRLGREPAAFPVGRLTPSIRG